MSVDLDTFKERFKYGFSDITNVGKPSSTPSFMTNEQLYSLSPDRFNFYVQLTTALMTGDPSVVYRALGIESASRHQRQRVRDMLDDIGKQISVLESKKPIPVEKVVEGGGYWSGLNDKLTANKDNDIGLAAIAKQNQADFSFSPETMRATTTDRVVFIGMTFALRSFSLTFLEWALTNRMVNRTETAIVFYVCMYLLMFLLWVFIVNVGKRDLFLKVAFYFVNTQGPRGLIRIVVHLCLQLLLLPIPFILQTVNQNSNTSSYLSFEERRRTLRLVGNLSFLMWMVSSIVALRA